MKLIYNYQYQKKILLLILTIIIHIVCIFQYINSSQYTEIPVYYSKSVIVLLIFDTVIAVLNSIKLQTIPNLSLFYLRGFIILIIGYTIQTDFLIETLLYIDYCTDTRLYNNWKFSVIYLAGYSLILTIIQYPNPLLGRAFLNWDFQTPSIWDCIAFYFFLLLFTGIMFAAIYFKERLNSKQAELFLEKQIKSKLLRLNQGFQDYASKAEHDAKTKERMEITQEIHDSTGYSFTNIISLMDVAIGIGDEDFDRLTEIHMIAKKEAKNGLRQTRKILQYIRNQDKLYNIDKTYDIVKLIGTFRKVTKIDVQLNIVKSRKSYGEYIDSIIFSIIREALTNILQHSNATQVLIYFRDADKSILLSVNDNGGNSGKTTLGIGLSGIQNRIEEIGGSVAFLCSPYGFNIKTEIPVDSAKNDK